MPEASVKDMKELPEVLTMAQVQQFLGLSKPKTYELAHVQGFPAVRFGRAIRVPRQQLMAWIAQQSGQMTL